MNGHTTVDQLAEQFQTLCTELPAKIKDYSEEQRLAAIRNAQKAIRLLQTPDEFATQQTWAVS